MAGVDYYDLLGVSPQAGPAELKSAYRRLAKTLHPDAGGNSALFRLVTEAYDTVSDPVRRRHYDAGRADSGDLRPAGPGTPPSDPAEAAHGEPPRPGASRTAGGGDASAAGSARPGPAGTGFGRPGAGSTRMGSGPTGGSGATHGSGAAEGSGAGGFSTADGSDAEMTSDAGATSDPGIPSARPDVSSLSWWDQVDPDGPVLWVPRFGLWARPFLGGAAVWIVLLGLLLVPAISRHSGPGLLDLTAVVPLVYVVLATVRPRVPRPLMIAAHLWAIGYAAFGVYSLRDSVLTGCWMLGLAIGTVVLPHLGRRHLRQRAMDRVFTREFRHFNTFGEPTDRDGGEPADDHPGEPGNPAAGPSGDEPSTRPDAHRTDSPGDEPRTGAPAPGEDSSLGEPEIDDDGEVYADGAEGRQEWGRTTGRRSAESTGESADSGGPVGGPPPHTDSAAELTASLLTAYLTRLPGARIFHRLSVPDAPEPLDHAVLCGSRLVLVNSAVWEPANYAIDEAGVVFRDGRGIPTGPPNLPHALAGYRKLLPRLEIQGVLLVHPSRGGELVCSAAVQAPVSMMTPSSFVQTIGEWLAATPYTVDRHAFLTVLGQLPT